MLTGPTYKTPAGETLQKALAFARCGVSGAEIYTFLSLCRGTVPEGRLFCACGEAGDVQSLVYHNGDLTVTKEDGVFPYPGLRLLRFAGERPAPDARVQPLTASDAQEIYRVIGQKRTLSPDEEARWVYRVRAMREGFACGYGVKQNGELLSFAFLVAQNADSALLGDVFTRPDHRGQGYASACVLACVRHTDKAVYALCEEKNVRFYAKLGFGGQC